jgi:type III restriction enzyme
MNLAVDQPILNNPFQEPTRYWLYEQGQPRVENGRRSAGYYFKTRNAPKAQMTMLSDEQFVELQVVNTIRARVSEWRKNRYAGATSITQRLFEYWSAPDRERPLFFCQREAAETLIWLTEIYPREPRGLQIPLDRPEDAASLTRGYKPLKRYGCKMATGSGKTVVMAMIAAWSILNKAQYPNDKRFSNAVLVVCPNITIKERLQVLKPAHPQNYYDKFDLAPRDLRDKLNASRFFVTNWHEFAPQDDSRRRSVVQRGEENETAFANRVLRKELSSARNLLVLNDEAHHAYRPALVSDEKAEALTPEERAEKEEATVWISGLDRINAARGINLCVDLSATPFYIHGSGYEEGKPLPWLVSDFGLVDAIESGIVKIPRVPVDSDSGQLIPEYFRLWEWINSRLPSHEKATARRKPKPQGVLREADGALQQLAGEWTKSLADFQKNGNPVPPALIVVCDNTDIAQVMYEYIGGETTTTDEATKKRVTVFGTGRVFPEHLQNSPTFAPTMRIDSKLLAEAESANGETKAQAARALRDKVNTVGKTEWEGAGEPPGKNLRCVVSVAMLNEGWDAQNVTQILGLRAFDSQLLCEQVVGRGLRRSNYNFEFDENGIPKNEEYVDVYGIPFEVIPVKKKPVNMHVQVKDSTLVQALKERAEFEITFPRVEGFVFDVKDRIKADIAVIPPVIVTSRNDPTETIVRPQVGYQSGAPNILGPGQTVTQTRQQFYETVRVQEIEYEIARRITNELAVKDSFKFRARQKLFPQVLAITREFIEARVECEDADQREIGLLRYVEQITDRLRDAIEPDDAHGEVPLLPRIERFRPKGSTSEVLFRTTRPCKGTTRSHVSHVVLDSPTWEGSTAYQLEKLTDLVETYVRNDHLDFVIPYEFMGQRHNYTPDYLVRLRNKVMLILEVKGYEDEQDRQQYLAAQRWAKAVTRWGEMGRWEFRVIREPRETPTILNAMQNRLPA